MLPEKSVARAQQPENQQQSVGWACLLVGDGPTRLMRCLRKKIYEGSVYSTRITRHGGRVEGGWKEVIGGEEGGGEGGDGGGGCGAVSAARADCLWW